MHSLPPYDESTRPVQAVLDPPARRNGVSQRPIKKKSALVSSSALTRLQPVFERTIGLLLLMLSFAGSVAAFNGGWTWPLDPLYALVGIALQAFLTVTQWIYRNRRISWQYAIAIGFDAGLSIAGYQALLYGWVAGVLTQAGVTSMLDVGTWAIIGIAATVLAIIPEAVLID